MSAFANVELRDDVVVVTGAAGGLGRHLIQRFLEVGARVVAIDRVDLNAEHQHGLHFILQDISCHSDADRVVDSIRSQYGAVEILVNAAGTFLPDLSPLGIDAVVETLWASNVRSALHLTLGLRPLLANGRTPLVVNIASTDAVVASAGQECEVGVAHDILYATTKGALLTFTRALAMTWAQQRIRVNALCPTIFDSPMTLDLLSMPGKREELESHIPLRRLCSTRDVADAVIGMYGLMMTTGHVLPVDGGYLCQ